MLQVYIWPRNCIAARPRSYMAPFSCFSIRGCNALCNYNHWFIYSIHILNQHKSHRTLLSAILNTGLYLHIILYIWIFPRYLLFYSIFDKMPIDKYIYNNNQSLNVQNTCCKSTILLPDSISAILNQWTIADHLVYFNKNLLFSIYFVGNYKKYIKKKNNIIGIHHFIYI